MHGKHPVLQGLIDSAYSRWVGSVSRADWLAGLDEDEVTAVHFGDMNYHVENGGWSQWVGNGYASLKVIQFLTHRMRHDLEQTPDVIAAARVLEEATPHLRNLIDYSGSPSNGECVYDEDCLLDVLEHFDSRYYETNDGLVQAVENYLALRQALVLGGRGV